MMTRLRLLWGPGRIRFWRCNSEISFNHRKYLTFSAQNKKSPRILPSVLQRNGVIHEADGIVGLWFLVIALFKAIRNGNRGFVPKTVAKYQMSRFI